MKNKKNLIWIALVAILLVVILLLVFGKKDDTTPSIGNEVVTPTMSLEVTKIPHSILTSTPKVEPTKGVDDEEIDIPTAPIVGDEEDDKNDTTIKDDVPNFDDGEEEVVTPTPIIVPTPSVGENDNEDDKDDEVKVTSTPSPTPIVASPTPQVTKVPQVTSTPTPIPTQKPQVTPNVGSDSGETIKLDAIGVEIPKRDSFNSEALENTKDSTWYGKVGDTEEGNALIDTLDSIFYALKAKGVVDEDCQAFLLQDNQISWDWLSFSGTHGFSLVRNPSDGEYVLEINNPLDKDEAFGRDHAPYNREVVITMLSVISSRPNELFDYIYEGLYEDASILNDMIPQKVGDCQVLIDTKASYKGHYVFIISE